MSRMIILGSGTALPDHERDNTSMVWDSPAGAVLIDCGGGAFQHLLRLGIDIQTLRMVLLTHAHPDHIYGLPALVFHLWLAGYRGTLQVGANPPTLATARRLCEALELEAKGHMCAVEWLEIDDGGERLVEETADYQLWTTPVEHSIPCLAVKLIVPETGRTLVFSADTQPCASLEQFAQNAQILIHEATTKDPNAGHGHTTPRQAGEVATRARVERLVLIHYSAEYTMPEAEAIKEVRAGGFAGEVAIAHDLAVYDV